MFYIVTVHTTSQFENDNGKIKTLRKNVKYVVETDNIEKACEIAQKEAFLEYDEATSIGAREFNVNKVILDKKEV